LKAACRDAKYLLTPPQSGKLIAASAEAYTQIPQHACTSFAACQGSAFETPP